MGAYIGDGSELDRLCEEMETEGRRQREERKRQIFERAGWEIGDAGTGIPPPHLNGPVVQQSKAHVAVGHEKQKAVFLLGFLVILASGISFIVGSAHSKSEHGC